MRLLLLLCLLLLSADAFAQNAPDASVRKRSELAHRKRRIILNNDGCDVLYYPKNLLPVTIEKALSLRTSPLVGSQVDTIFYCPISSGFSNFTCNTKVGTVLEHNVLDGYNATRDLIALGTDALKMVVDFGHANGIEVFFSMRMNDTHDGAQAPDRPYPLFPPLKAQHPEWLIGSYENKPKYCQWTAVDYGRPEIRDLAFRYLQEVCHNYDVDGIELDFWRHIGYFRSVAYGGIASQEERDLMTGLLRRVREMTETEGRRRGRPILIAVRVPDSVEYSRGVGLDLERWLQEGLVDLLVGTCYFQLNPWEHLVGLGHKYEVPVYPGLSESRVRGEARPYQRNGIESYRARAAQVWQSGADGVYLFNFFNPKAAMLREIGDPATLARLDKTYFVTPRNYSPELYLKGGKQYLHLPVLTPDNPLALAPGTPQRITLSLGETAALENPPQVKLCLLSAGANPPTVELNGQKLAEPGRAAGWWEYPVAVASVRPGDNEIVVGAPMAPADQQWDVTWTGAEKLAAPWSRDPGGKATVTETRDGALLIADRGTNVGDYLYYSYAWNASPERETVAEVEARVISGQSAVIFSNGVAADRLLLKPDGLSLYSNGAAYPMNTTDTFHTYRIVLQGRDLRVFVDDKLALDAPGKFTAESPAGRNAIQFGAANSPEVGEALWRAVRFRGGGTSLFDLLMRFDYP